MFYINLTLPYTYLDYKYFLGLINLENSKFIANLVIY